MTTLVWDQVQIIRDEVERMRQKEPERLLVIHWGRWEPVVCSKTRYHSHEDLS